MSDSCSHHCESCSKKCSDRKSMLQKPHELSHIKKVIGVVSGKGGVGKSMVTSQLAVLANRAGYRTAILDADITGPSIPQAFGVHGHADSDDKGLYPMETSTGIKVMSINLLTEHETDPVLWRGPIIAGMVGRFWKDVIWGDVDYMFIDMPPGTGDVPLTVFQTIPVDGIVVVTSPQQLVGMIVEKAVKMAYKMSVPILGIVENMSFYTCPGCGDPCYPFGESRIDGIAAQQGIEHVAKLPIDPKLAAGCDAGEIEKFEGNWLNELFQYLQNV